MSKKREKSTEQFVEINTYPKLGGGVPISGGRKAFDPKVVQHCSDKKSEMPALGEKIIVVGDHSVGKTSLIKRYVDDSYADNYKATIGVDFMHKKYKILDSDFMLHIWDTAGQEQFKCVSRAYFRGASAVILTFDLGNLESLENVKGWMREVEAENKEQFLIFLVGLKSDMFHAVDNETGQRMAANLNAEYWECSSKQNTNVNELFERMAVGLFERAIVRHFSANDEASETTPQLTTLTLQVNNDNNGAAANEKKKKSGRKCII